MPYSQLLVFHEVVEISSSFDSAAKVRGVIQQMGDIK